MNDTVLNENRFRIPEAVALILSRLGAEGHRADVVGGPVRDHLLGVTPHDFDITTDATPNEIKAAFPELRTVDTGIKHGTVSLIIDGECYEVTTYRVDGEYKDNRHPESVTFTKRLAEDLARRDFTVNAICYNPTDGFTDLYGGREDIDRRIIRAVGEPERRFTEDALRIMRGARFASTLGFTIEDATLSAMIKTRGLLNNVSAERIWTEWKKTLEGRCAHSVLTACRPIFEEVIPELSGMRLPPEEGFASQGFLPKMLALFLLTRKDDPEEAFLSAVDRLKTEKQVRTLGAKVLRAYGKYQITSLKEAGRVLSELGREAAELLAATEEVVKVSKKSRELISEYLSLGLPYGIGDLAVGGTELLELGVTGRAIGETLFRLLSAVINGEAVNESESLLALAKALARKS